jgi:hypothetical protein
VATLGLWGVGWECESPANPLPFPLLPSQAVIPPRASAPSLLTLDAGDQNAGHRVTTNQIVQCDLGQDTLWL